ncbi:hypothetical protein BDW02DRAFT_248172 [Decorospora gaudefroyi]|uniref:Uncharacterized protein n=1 Tax=Decorospora gaudefroyi TaxID=184978 RepID=A0A6A5KK45_9PLEO|nr:hypothetical protein BDW02DRAFT_248172 [Decorospora gaudefroyi]
MYLESRPKPTLREHGLREAWYTHAFMPGSLRPENEWLNRSSVTWLSQPQDCHVSDLKRSHSIIVPLAMAVRWRPFASPPRRSRERRWLPEALQRIASLSDCGLAVRGVKLEWVGVRRLGEPWGASKRCGCRLHGAGIQSAGQARCQPRLDL